MDMITFIVPAYNAEDTLCKTIDSILNQTDSRYQIVIVNDGSTDGTDSICEQYHNKYPRKVTYVKQENKGLGGARNCGIKYVNTPYVTFLDSDDWLMLEYVEGVLAQLKEKQYTKIEMIMTLPQIYHEKSRAVMDWHDKVLFQQVFPKDGQVVNPQQDKRLYHFEVNQCRKILSMEFVRKIGFHFREQIKWEDVYPHIYLLSKCTSCMGIGSLGFYYRVGRKGQITASTGIERLDILQVFDDILGYIQSEDRKDIQGQVMEILVRFSIWNIQMSNENIRKPLVKALHKRFAQMPFPYYKALIKECRTFSKREVRQDCLFMAAIKYPIGYFFLYDYLYQEIGEKIVKKFTAKGKSK